MIHQTKTTAYIMMSAGIMHLDSIRSTKRHCILDFPMDGMQWSEFKQHGYEVVKIEIRVL